MVQLSRSVPLFLINPTLWSRNPDMQARRFGLFRVRSPLLAESLLISTPPGTEMFHFPGCRSEALFYSDSSDRALPRPGSPIQKSSD
jgi:hypothetical protein